MHRAKETPPSLKTRETTKIYPRRTGDADFAELKRHATARVCVGATHQANLYDLPSFFFCRLRRGSSISGAAAPPKGRVVTAEAGVSSTKPFACDLQAGTAAGAKHWNTEVSRLKKMFRGDQTRPSRRVQS